MSYRPELILELVGAINSQNDLDLKVGDVALTSPVFTDDAAMVKIVKGTADYYGRKYVTYRRLDPSKFFKNIPVRSIVDNLGKTVTGIQVLAVINTYWPDLIPYEDIEQEDLEKPYTLGELLSMPATFRFKGSSQSWKGTFSLSVAQRFINLGYIVDDGAVTLEGPSPQTVRSYYADFTPYAQLLSATESTGTLDEDLFYLLSRGLPGINVKDAAILYNGKTANVTDRKVNTDFTHVMLLKPTDGTDKDIVYVNYNYSDSSVNAIVTESGDILTDESGNVLVLE